MASVGTNCKRGLHYKHNETPGGLFSTIRKKILGQAPPVYIQREFHALGCLQPLVDHSLKLFCKNHHCSTGSDHDQNSVLQLLLLFAGLLFQYFENSA